MQIKYLFDIQHPIVQAPMAGGPTTVDLVSKISNLGGLGSVGAGYLPASDLENQIRRLKKKTAKPFSVNLFVNDLPENREVIQTVRNKISKLYDELDLGPTNFEPELESKIEDQIDVVIAENTPVISCTFGFFNKDQLTRLKKSGAIVVGNATSVDEAVYVESMGADAVIAQGFEAGGHRGSFLPTASGGFPLVGSMSLIPRIVDRVKVPVLAAGGISDGRSILAAISLGASGVQIGTVFLTTHEAKGNSEMVRKLIEAKDTDTVLTKSFSGKLARGVFNRFIQYFEKNENEIPNYPIMNAITSKIRKKAKDLSTPDLMSLWAGQSSCYARNESAEEAFNRLISEYNYHREKFQSPNFELS